MSESTPTRDGKVIRSTGSWYDVQTDEGVVPSKVRGKFRLVDKTATNPVAVGDRVRIRMSEDETGYIEEIYERENRLVRRAAGRRIGMEHVIVANVDRAWCVQASAMPHFNHGFVDRFIVMAEAFGIPSGLVVNKWDLVDTLDPDQREDLAFFLDLYQELGYEVVRTSATEAHGLDEWLPMLADRVNVVAGPSGVGKSSLLNALAPELSIRTGEVSEKNQKGRHTTTHAELHPLPQSGYVVDTPGIREFGIVDLEPMEVAHYFVEFIPYLDECHFPNCTHDHEPKCAVKDAVDEGEITEVRYVSYLNILDSVLAGEEDTGR